MYAIVKREFKNYVKNPVLWIGLILVIWGVYVQVSPYLNIHYFRSEEEVRSQWEGKLDAEVLSDGDVTQGLIPADDEAKKSFVLDIIQGELVDNHVLEEEEAQQVFTDMKDQDLSVPDLINYLENSYGIPAGTYFNLFQVCPGTMEQVNDYISACLEEHPFSWYFARKFADFAGLFMSAFAAVLLAFLFIRDTKKDMYELLHTKPLSPASYIGGKAAGGMAVIVTVLAVLNAVFGVLCVICGKRAGFSVNVLDLLWTSVVYILPNMLMITCVYACVALVFRNPLPAVPLLVVYMVYSNMGRIGPDGSFGYYGRPLAIMVRFPGRFFETAPPPLWALNQCFLIVASVLLAAGAAELWRRRKI